MFPGRIDGADDIRRHARGALVAAGVLNVTPVPLSAVAEAVNLKQEKLYELGADAPAGLKDRVAGLSSKLLGFINIKKKTIYVDPDLSAGRHRFTTAHEIGHHALPWQEGAYHVDDEKTLSDRTRVSFELEASAFAGELLTGAGAFNAEADSEAPGIATPLALAERFGTSAQAALRQYVEQSKHPVALLTLSKYKGSSTGGQVLTFFQPQCFTSDSFDKKYGGLAAVLPRHLDSSQPLFHVLKTLKSTGPGGTTELVLDTQRGLTTFKADTFFNGQFQFVLLYRNRRLAGQKRVLVGLNGLPLS